ncbi:MAG: MBL fold metallo-hydrolase, partial [Oscillospiraceae bacterium]|nr:MBL fold metallo-hydrolase [Oscillospiraceae bacterium]
VVATHPHSDHIGGIPEAVENMPVDTFIIPEIPEKYIPTTLVYSNLLDAIDESNAQLDYAELNATYDLGEAQFTILSPSEEYTDLNNYSVVILLKFGDKQFLFMGDAEKKAEDNITEMFELPPIDVLKVGHHGSNTSSSKDFINIIQPEYAVIECGKDNSYGHPDSNIVGRISEYAYSIYRTDLEGDIVCSTDGKDIDFVYSRQD